MYKSFLEYQRQPRVQRSGSLKHTRYTKASWLLSVCIFLCWLNQISWLAASKMRWNSPVPTLFQLRQHSWLREIWPPKLSREELDPEGPLGSCVSLLKSTTSLFTGEALGRMQQQGQHEGSKCRIKAQPRLTKPAAVDGPCAKPISTLTSRNFIPTPQVQVAPRI